MNFVSIIIPAFNEEKYIADCIDSLQKQNFPKEQFEIIVIDNGSTDQTLSIAKSLGATTYLKENCNVGAVRNYGALKAQGDILAFIDSDCIVDENWLKRGVNLLNKEPDATFGGGCLLKDNPSWIEKYWLLGTPENRLPKALIGCSIFLSKKTFTSVGGFNESITSGEDTALHNDLKARGTKIEITSELSVVHLGNALTIQDFVKRQIWHSENYLKNMQSSLKDPVFFLTVSAIIGFVLGLCFLFIELKISFTAFALTLSLPLILSCKRIVRSKLNLKALLNLHQIYLLDLLYILGRVIGLSKGLKSKMRTSGSAHSS